jgi:hypothetical protein
MSQSDSLLPADISPDTRTLIKAIAVVQDLEQRLPLIDTVEEVERLRIQTVTISNFARAAMLHGENITAEWTELSKELERWAKRVGIMCHRRIGQLVGELKLHSGRPKKMVDPRRPLLESVPAPPQITLESLGLKKDFAATAKVLAGVSKEHLDAKLDEQIAADGEIRKKKLIAQIKAEAKTRGESIDDRTAANRARWRKHHQKKQSQLNQERAKDSPRARTSPSDKFKAYWSREKKLLYEFFETSDLEKVADYWWKEFHLYRMEEEKILSDLRQERERKKGLAELTKP